MSSSKLAVGIVGLPNVGKSTLFQTITQKQVDCANYPFCTIDPNVGVVAVPDERVDKLVDLTNSKKTVYATVEFVDIAGLVKGASKGEGLGNKFLANIREVDAMLYVLRAFKNENIINTQSSGIDPVRDKEILESELILKDIETIDKRMSSLEREVKAQKKEAIKELEVVKKAAEFLNDGKSLFNCEFNDDELVILNNYQLLSLKPKLFLLNGKDEEISDELKTTFDNNNWPYLVLDILNEFDGASLTQEEREEFGIEELRINSLIKACYKLLGLINFFTTGPDETRAWVLKYGSTAPQAGGVIHSDFEKTFVKAEVINWKDLLDIGGFTKAREKGLIRTEGKEYIIKDGDVIEIKAGV